ncbi:phage repressor protein CI [Pectobacterium odoriferum]|uniref:phage repressor protein CI n=1 Tax=Pectobacterium odoriferum TaxID=78398 RepID=UPI0032ED8F4A
MNNSRKFSLPAESALVLDRVCEAYGFSTKLQLAEHLDMAASSLSARYKRGVFPADIVAQCALETGANLTWLTFGDGKKFDNEKLDILKFHYKKLIDGQLYDSGYVMFDKVLFLPGVPLPENPICVIDEKTQYIIDQTFSDVYDGQWLVEIEEKISIRTLTRIPVRRLRVSGVGMAFDCGIDDIKIIGKVKTEIGMF